ncbi:Uncharacterised protein [Mycobacterium tuberculosis]|nr:Uncharacterised protein [Mycobacterium tuberculosis]
MRDQCTLSYMVLCRPLGNICARSSSDRPNSSDIAAMTSLADFACPSARYARIGRINVWASGIVMGSHYPAGLSALRTGQVG